MKTPQTTRLYFEIFESSVLEAAELVDSLLDISSRRARGSSHGGWYASFYDDGFHSKVWRNAHDTGAGHGIEYHRPEFPNYDIMLWISFFDPKQFTELQKQLRHPNTKLFITGFERNWPDVFWGVDHSKSDLGLVKGHS